MAFWGVEVKPGKPYIHRFDDELGRLRLSQATLGSGSSTKRSIVQCTVGSNPPINLCSLLPEKIETSPLNLEFEEEEEVTFSVVGPTSIHLSGFFYGDTEEDCGDDCEEDCGLDHYEEDISDSEEESDNSADFDSIDYSSDDQLDMFPAARRKAKSGVIIEEIHNEKASDKNASSEQNNATAQPDSESEDEDGFPKSSTGKSELKEAEKVDEESLKKKRKNGSELSKNLKRKVEALREDIVDDSLPQAHANDVASDIKTKQKNKKKKVGIEAVARDNSENLDSMNTPPAAKDDISQNLVNENKDKKKKNKQKKDKKQNSASDVIKEENVVSKEESDKTEKEPFQVRTFPNGMVVEELAMGKPNGSKASNGKKVSMRYIGKLKKNGKIFDSNIGKAPFQFRLGIGEVIKGWDVGVNGMRVGDKRRLTIPPSMGYGAKGAGSAIPGNAWLVFDVELVGVK